jgi:hypothetical protein
MKVLFAEIRSGDLAAVTSRLDGDPKLVHAVAKAPPKKDDGQSTLQAAIKSGKFDMASLLLDRGADVNYIDRSTVNTWNMPVLHDALRATVFSTRFGRNRAFPEEPPKIEIMSTLEQFEAAFAILERLISLGADVLALDSHGNPALGRALLDACQVIDEPILPDLASDLTRVFDLLLASGADVYHVDPRVTRTLLETFRSEPVGRFIPEPPDRRRKLR